MWLPYCFNALRAFWIFQNVLIRNGEQKKASFTFGGYVKMDTLVMTLAAKLVIWQSQPIANIWCKLLLYFGVGLWSKQFSQITCRFIFFRWLATSLKWPVISVALSNTGELQSFTFRLSLFFWVVRSVKWFSRGLCVVFHNIFNRQGICFNVHGFASLSSHVDTSAVNHPHLV